MALSFARLSAAAQRGDDAPARVVTAMTQHPFLVGGSDRFDTALMTALEGKVLCKIGAEGVHTLAVLDSCIGIAVKVEDGTQRAQYQAVLSILQTLGVLDDAWPEALRDLAPRIVRNTRGEQVGTISVGDGDVGSVI
jgi:L-asparaginase II